MKIISYALFGSRTTEPWLFNFYLRGFVWNVKMNKLIYPGWQTHVEIDADTFSDYDHIFYGLKQHYGISYNVNIQEPLCKSMLWRLKPVFWDNSEVVLCRDADAITTYRETLAVKYWLEDSGYKILGLNDNPAHRLPLMGGMIGVVSEFIRTSYISWDNFMSGSGDLSNHGSDQDYVMRSLYARFKDEVTTLDTNQIDIFYNKKSSYWTSDLTCRHIGSAGVVEMETIRFFKQHDGNSPFIEIEKKYPQIFYWHL